MDRRFKMAMVVYAVLALLAILTLDGPFRIGTLVFLAGVALKTWLVVLRRKLD
jgi:uncharacterized membrane protein YczE